MKNVPTLTLAFVALVAPLAVRAQTEVGWIEKFALAADRETVLDQLLPGSEDFYFYHALHYQNTRQAAKFAATLAEWGQRFPQSQRRKIIENRAALLAYDADPQTTLKFLRDRLRLEFNDQQEARDQKPDLPTTLDPAAISRAAFLQEALKDKDNLQPVNDEGLAALVRDKTPLSPAQTRDLLSRLKRPDLPGLVDLIEKDLESRQSRGFGEFGIHHELLPEQLDELAQRLPALYGSQNFVYTRLRKLAPGADADAEFDRAEREAWLGRLWTYAKNLSPSFNSLKAQILLQRLQLERERGTYDKTLFQTYLKLPRRANYVSVEWLQRAEAAGQAADLTADVSEVLGSLPLIHSDEALVRDYLLHLLKDEPSWEPWQTWLQESWLKSVFAESKIINGVGDPEKWASLIPPTAFQTLKDRVDVDFALTNPPFLGPADDVTLDLFLKNTPKLIVKIYEINTLSYYLANARQINTDLALDGLVANREVTHDFTTDEAGRNPFRRTKRTFKFPELNGQRGAWVIEFIGGGKSSRALVRKGQWTLLQHTSAAGDVITVLDEARQPVKDAVVWVDGRKLAADPATANILVPFTHQAGTKAIILADAAGTFATLTTFEHHAEQYRLDAQIFVEREQLLAHREATIAVHAALLLNDSQVSLDLIQDPKLTIKSTSLDGVSTTQEVKIEKLDPARVFTHTIAVPERLAQLAVTLSGQVPTLSAGGELQNLLVPYSISTNGIDESAQVYEAHLSRFAEDYVFELLGRNGEPIPNRQVELQFTRPEFHHVVKVALRTDEKGRIHCGNLADIAQVTALAPAGEGAEASTLVWYPKDSGRTWAESIHAAAGEPVRIPWTNESAPAWVSLLEERAGTFVADRHAAVALEANGAIVPNDPAAKSVSAIILRDLPAGDYRLNLPPGHVLQIRITAGQAVQNWLLSANRELEVRDPTPLNIASIHRENGALVIRLANAGKFARVHVVATRFLPETTVLNGLGGFTRFEPGSSTPAKTPNLFAGGREIGDEYRYILERRYSHIFPGNMLPRPGLLLNPWEVRSTDVQSQSLAASQAAPASQGGRGGAAQMGKMMQEPRPGSGFGGASEVSDLEFLAKPAPALFDLVPDEKGEVHLDLKALGDRQHVQIYAEDLRDAAWRTVALAEVPTQFQDVRLARNLDPTKSFTEKKETTLLQAEQTLTLNDLQTAEFETYDSLATVYTLLTTIVNTPPNPGVPPPPELPTGASHPESSGGKLAKFSWILQWPTMTDEQKRAKYSEFACHELNFFVSRKDPAFFEKVVVPFLKNKKDRTFMDDYLLGRDLHPYLEPWAFERLNAAERCLLARHLPAEAASVARHERELWEMLTPDPEGENLLFETALHGRTLTRHDPDRDGYAPVAATLTSGTKVNLPHAAASASNVGEGRLANADAAMAPHPLAMPPPPPSEDEKALRKATDKDASAGKTNVWIEQNNLRELNFDELKQQREKVRQFFRALGPTKEWAENNYYKVPLAAQGAGLIPANAFWRDYAAWDGKSPFLSTHVAEAGRSFPEIMLALSILDLPFESPKVPTRSENGQLTLTAGGPLIAYHKEIKPAVPAAGPAPLLLSQNFFRFDDRYRSEGNEKVEKYVSDEFLSGVVYGANIVVTNPTSARQKVSVLLQIPRGSLPVNGSKVTESRPLQLEPYSTQTLEYYFYFPSPAATAFPHYPVHVAREEEIVGEARPTTFKVVSQLSQVDKTSWDYVSQYAAEDDVFSFLEKTNIQRLNLDRIAWRARQSADFFHRLVATLEKRHVYSERLYRYSLIHNEPGPLATWLRHRTDFLDQCGPYLKTRLLTIDPIERRSYEHLEYLPLVNQRAHRIGAEDRIANPVLRKQDQHLMTILAYKPALDAMDQLSVVYYLFLQDRVEEALARFHGIVPENLPTRLQYDYLRCYAALYEEQLPVARGLTQQYADYPIDRWRKLFAEVGAQLDEIEGKQPVRPGEKEPNREKQQGELAASEPSFAFKVENRQIALTWKNLREVTIRYYLMDPEFLFSASPFVTEDSGRFSIIKPTRSDTQALPEGKDQLSIPLPAEFTKANVLVEILGAGLRQTQTYHANTLKLSIAENYGRLEVRDDLENKPASKAYVKVYARLKNGTVRFYKDGYTDLRGRFDYASLNSSENESGPAPASRNADGPNDGANHQMLAPNELNQVARFAILVSSRAHGAEVREAAPPAP
jgi:hypothetical protein